MGIQLGAYGSRVWPVQARGVEAGYEGEAGRCDYGRERAVKRRHRGARYNRCSGGDNKDVGMVAGDRRRR